MDNLNLKCYQAELMGKKITFLVDEDVLGIDRYIAMLDVNIKKVGDPDAPPLGSEDPVVAKYASDNKYVIITGDDKMVKQCRVFDIEYVTTSMEDLARKVVQYVKEHPLSEL